MKERPILFNTEMVRAILDGRKTETRRVIKPQLIIFEYKDNGILYYDFCGSNRGVVASSSGVYKSRESATNYFVERHCPYGVPGDRLWVRETWVPVGTAKRKDGKLISSDNVIYRADGAKLIKNDIQYAHGYWKPSIFMPRWASRIMLEITDIRVERVQDITESGAVVEGWPSHKELFPLINTGDKALTWYRSLWNKINAKRGYSFDINPWVWVIKFKEVSG